MCPRLMGRGGGVDADWRVSVVAKFEVCGGESEVGSCNCYISGIVENLGLFQVHSIDIALTETESALLIVPLC